MGLSFGSIQPLFSAMPQQRCEPLPILRVDESATHEADCAKEQASRKLHAEFGPAVVKVTRPGGSGSGFFIGDGSQVVTNFHVVNDTNGVLTVETFDHKLYKARVEKLDDINDLAILRLEGGAKNKETLKIGSSQTLKADEPLYALGHPEGRHDTYISPGKFTANGTFKELFAHRDPKDVDWVYVERLLKNPDPAIAADAHAYREAPKVMAEVQIEGGNSGGPLINNKGEVVGVSQFGSELPQFHKYSWDVPSEKIQELLNGPNKFRLDYHHSPYLFQRPITTVVTTGVMGGLAAFPRSGGALLGVVSAIDMIHLAEGKNATPLTTMSDKVYRGLEWSSDIALVSGAAVSWVPKLKTAGKYGLAAGVVLTAAQSLVPQLGLDTITRADGSTRTPFMWDK